MAISSVGTKVFMSKVEHTDLDTPPAGPQLVDFGCEVTDTSITGGTTGEIDTTPLCSNERRFIAGLIDSGTAAFTVFYDGKADSAYLAAVAAYDDRKNRYFKVELSDGSSIEFIGFMNQWSLPLGIEQAVTADMGIRISGKIQHTPVAAVGG